MSFLFSIDPTTALANNIDQITLFLINWGNVGATADANSLTIPTQDFPLAGVALIGPFQRLLQLSVTMPTGGGALGYNVTDQRAFIGATPGRWTFSASSQMKFGDTYNPMGAPTSNAWGRALPAPGRWTDPVTQAILYLNTPEYTPVGGYPPDNQVELATALPAATTEFISLAYPVLGRKTVRVTCWLSGGGGSTASVIVTGIMPWNTSPAGAREFSLGFSAVAMAVGDVTTFLIQVPTACFIAVKGTNTGGTPTLNTTVLALD